MDGDTYGSEDGLRTAGWVRWVGKDGLCTDEGQCMDG